MFAAVAKVTGVAGLVLLAFAKPLSRLAGQESGPSLEALPVGSEADTRRGVQPS